MLVPFAVVCDLCGTRGEEYSGGYHCRDCGRDCCLKCAQPGTDDADFSWEGPETGYVGSATVLCHECAARVAEEWIEDNSQFGVGA